MYGYSYGFWRDQSFFIRLLSVLFNDYSQPLIFNELFSFDFVRTFEGDK